MKKILYLMGVDWYWIKQRPQIVAEMLAKDYDITVVYQKEIVKNIALRKNKDELKNSIALPVLPLRDKNNIVHVIQKFIFKWEINNIHEYDLIWVGHPLLYRYIPPSFRGKIVYDCMDNHVALCMDSVISEMIYESEMKLLERADLVFVSSNHLKNGIETIYHYTKAVLVRNGFMKGIIHRPSKVRIEDKVKIGYFGTIAEWIDFEILLNSLEEAKEVEYHFWGPVLDVKVPQHPRILMEGVAEHKQLWDKAKDLDCLIMPFKINSIIEDVDPVKLYEYISMGKTIIAPYYGELERFTPYVHFYHNEREFVELLDRLRKGELAPKYSEVAQDDFLMNNTWDKRYEIVRINLLRITGEDNFQFKG